MTDEMLALARKNAADVGVRNVHFLKGVIEGEVHFQADSVDIVISNCVINLFDRQAGCASRDGPRPSARRSDWDQRCRAEDRLSPEARGARSYVGCIAGALSMAEYKHELEEAGFEQVSIRLTHAEADKMYGAIVRATEAHSLSHSAEWALEALLPFRRKRILAWLGVPLPRVGERQEAADCSCDCTPIAGVAAGSQSAPLASSRAPTQPGARSVEDDEPLKRSDARHFDGCPLEDYPRTGPVAGGACVCSPVDLDPTPGRARPFDGQAEDDCWL